MDPIKNANTLALGRGEQHFLWFSQRFLLEQIAV
jgi:hypothetical protein